MYETIDMHCHILPGVDDGAADPETSRKMLQMAWGDGIGTIIATPHLHPVKGKSGPRQWEKALAEVRKLAAEIDSSLRVLPGCEIWYQQGIEELLLQGGIWTMCGSRYVLTEFSSGTGFSGMTDGLLNLQRCGYYPILAHVERYACLVDLGKVRELVQMGICLQMNAGTVLAGREWLRGRRIREMLKKGYIHLIGTDAHDTSGRKPRMRECRSYLKKICGGRYAAAVCGGNAEKIIAGEKLPI